MPPSQATNSFPVFYFFRDRSCLVRTVVLPTMSYGCTTLWGSILAVDTYVTAVGGIYYDDS